eukprot:Rmarinus@m.7468
MDWKNDILSQLTLRNRLECSSFVKLLEVHTQIVWEDRSLQTQCEQLEHALRDSQSTVHSLREELKVLKEENSSASLITQLKEKVHALTTELNSSLKEKSEHSHELQWKSTKLEDTLKKVEETNQRLAELIDNKKRMELRLNEMKSTCDAEAAEVRMLRADNHRLQVALTAANEMVANAQLRALGNVADGGKQDQNLTPPYSGQAPTGDLTESMTTTLLNPIEVQESYVAAPTQDIETLAPGRASRVQSRVPSNLRKHIAAHSFGPVNAIAYSSDGGMLASCGSDRGIFVWDALSGKAKKAMQPAPATVMHVRFSPDDDYLLGGGADKVLKLWELDSGKIVSSYDSPSSVLDVCFVSSDPNRFIATHESRITMWHKEETFRPLFAMATGDQPVTASVVSRSTANSPLVFSGHRDGSVQLWSVKAAASIAAMQPITGRVCSLALHPLGSMLLVVGGSGACLVDTRTSEVEARMEALMCGGGACFSPCGRYILVGTADGGLCVWDSHLVSQKLSVLDLSPPLSPSYPAGFAHSGSGLGSDCGSGIGALGEDHVGLIGGSSIIGCATSGHAGSVGGSEVLSSGQQVGVSAAVSQPLQVGVGVAVSQPLQLTPGSGTTPPTGLGTPTSAPTATPTLTPALTPTLNGSVGSGALTSSRHPPLMLEPLQVMAGHASSVLDCAWSPTGLQVAACDSAKVITLWD